MAVIKCHQFNSKILLTKFHLWSTILMVNLFLLAGCGESDDLQKNLPAEEALPVSILQMRPTNVPIFAETVAQTEGAKETEIRPRVGGILLKRLYHEGAPVVAGQPLFKIDPVPFENALAEAGIETPNLTYNLNVQQEADNIQPSLRAIVKNYETDSGSET